jgi:hypothetical protein
VVVAINCTDGQACDWQDPAGYVCGGTDKSAPGYPFECFDPVSAPVIADCSGG